MKLILGILILIVLVSAGLVLFNKKDNSTDTKQAAETIPQITACETFSLQDAKNVLGSSVVLDPANQDGSKTFEPSEKNSSQKTTSCIYLKGAGEQKQLSSTSTDSSGSKPVAKDSKSQNNNSTSTLDKLKSQVSQTGTSTIEIAANISLRISNPNEALKSFDSTKPKSVEQVQNYGQEAYWADSEDLIIPGKHKQLNILVNGNILSISGQKLSLEQAKKIADIAIGKIK